MQKNLQFFRVASAALLFLFLSGIAIQQGFAIEQQENAKGNVLSIADQPKDKVPGKPCDPGAPCSTHTPPRGGDLAVDNSVCTTGTVCNSPGPGKCGPGNIGACQTTQMGGGNCACQCIMQ